MTQERKAHVEGNGAIAQDGSVAAQERGATYAVSQLRPHVA